MGNLIGWIITKGIPAKYARFVAFAGLALILLAAMAGLKCSYDRNLIRTHDSKREAQIVKADRKADAKAAEQRRVDDALIMTESHELKDAIHEAGNDPAARRAAYYECVRELQQARRDRRSPGC